MKRLSTKKHNFLSQASVLAAALLLSSCGMVNGFLQGVGLASKPPEIPIAPIEIPLSEQPMNVVLELTIDDDINPDVSNRPSPARARVFLSDSNIDLMSLPLEEIFEYGDNTLDLKPSASLTVRPGSTNKLVLDTVKTNNKITVAVAFRDPYSTQWIQNFDISVADSVEVSAQITPIAITLAQPQ